MIPVLFAPQARRDASEAQVWYAEQSVEASLRFENALEATVKAIARNPLQFPVVRKSIRRVVLERFPYVLYFRLSADEAQIIACVHGKRHPARWQSRA